MLGGNIVVSGEGNFTTIFSGGQIRQSRLALNQEFLGSIPSRRAKGSLMDLPF